MDEQLCSAFTIRAFSRVDPIGNDSMTTSFCTSLGKAT